MSPTLRAAKLRGAELARLAEHRRHERRDLGAFGLVARLVAENVVALVADADLGDFEQRARRLGVRIDPDLAVAEICAAEARRDQQGARWRLTSALHAGRMLGLTRAERSALRITTLEAIDESPEARRERVASSRRARDRAAKRLKRAPAKSMRASRRAAEIEVVESQNLSAHIETQSLSSGRRRLLRPEPWRALGMSRATFFRRKAEARALAAAAGSSKSDGDGDEPAPVVKALLSIGAPSTAGGRIATPGPSAAASGERGEAEGPNLSVTPPASGRRPTPCCAEADDIRRARARREWEESIAVFCGAPVSGSAEEIAA